MADLTDDLIQVDTEITVSDDQDLTLHIVDDDGSLGDLTGVAYKAVFREDPNWNTADRPDIDARWRNPTDDASGWAAAVTATGTIAALANYAGKLTIARAAMADLKPGFRRYVLEVSRTLTGQVASIIAPTWVSVRPAVSRPA